MISSLIVHGQNKAWFSDIWLNGLIWIAGAAVLALIGYLVIAKKPDIDDVLGILIAGIIGAFAWPVVVVGGLLAGLVLALRAAVHGRLLEGVRRRMARGDQRAQLIRELEAENARREAELGIGQ